MKRNKQYRDYLQNIDVQSYPSNRNLRIKSQQSEVSDNKSSNKSRQFSNVKFIYPKTSKNLDNININSNIKINNTRQIKTEYENQTQKEQYEYTLHPYSRINQLQLPYDTQQLNKNVSKVLSQIEQIQSQFRKLSSQNSLHMKQSIIYKNQVSNEQRSNFLQSLMKKIKKPINYEDKQADFIDKQKIQLIKLVKNLNKKLNTKLRQVQKNNQRQIRKSSMIQSRKRKVKTQYEDDNGFKNNQRTSSVMQFQRQLVQVVQQINSNKKLIQNMRNQFQFHNRKFQHYQNTLKNYKQIQSSIVQLHQLIKHKKQQLSRLRKKKFLTQKSIMSIQKRNGNIFGMNSKDILSTNCSTSTHSSQLLISLKQQYSQYLKKKQKLKNKIQLTKMHLNRIQELKDKNNVSKQHYEQLLQQMKRYPSIKNINQSLDNKQTSNSKNKLQNNNINQSRFSKYPQFINSKSIGIQQNQHIQFIYKARKSKLIMLMNTIKRNQQQLKRKYYHLLKQYQTMVDDRQNKNQLSPLKQSRSLKQYQLQKQKTPIYKMYQQHEKIIDDKLDKAKNEVIRMQKKIQRFSKIGKIIKKVNKLQQSNNEQNYTQEYDQDFNSQQQYEKDLQQQQTQNNYNQLQNNQNYYKFNNNNSPTKYSQRNNQLGSQSSFSNNNTSQKNRSLQRMASASSQFQTPYDQFDLKYDINKDYVDYSQYQKNKKFLTQDQRSYTTQLHQAIDKNSINLDRIKAEQHKSRAKYIGKFKKQRIIQKVDKKISQRDFSANKYNISKPIIEEQIQGTSEFDSSMMKNGIQSFDSEARIGTNLRRGKYEKQLLVPQQINQKEFEVRDRQDTSLQIDAQMLQMQRQLDKQQRQDDIKQKYAHILYRSKLFSS